MRKALFYNPRLLSERVGIALNERHRLRRLKGTRASWLTTGYIDTMELIDLAVRSGAHTLYDIGAHIGSWSLLCNALYPKTEIFAFEPQPGHTEQFIANTRGITNIRLFPCALGSRVETRTFYPATRSDASSFLPLTSIGKTQFSLDNEPPVSMDIVPLDDIVAREKLPAPDLIKLDVQGFELEVLRGGILALENARWVLSEVSFQPIYEGQVLFSELATFLAQHGYETYAFGHSVRAGVPLVQLDVLFRRA
jgi:FkbM family methyltransferase